MVHIIGIVRNSLADQVTKRLRTQYPQCAKNVKAERDGKFTTFYWMEGVYESKIVNEAIRKYIRQATSGVSV